MTGLDTPERGVSDMAELAEQVQYLVDRTKIIDRLYVYATAVDTKDWSLFRSIFADEIKIDFTSIFGGAPGWTHMSPDEWIAFGSGFIGQFESTQHSMSNPRVEIDGDVAKCVMYIRAQHYLKTDQGDEFWTIGGYYNDELVKVGNEWKLTAVKVTSTWEQGSPDVIATLKPARSTNDE